MIELVLKVDGEVELSICSNGKAHFKVQGRSLRFRNNKRVEQYTTRDDLKIVGEVNRMLGAFCSQEVLRRALDEDRKRR